MFESYFSYELQNKTPPENFGRKHYLCFEVSELKFGLKGKRKSTELKKWDVYGFCGNLSSKFMILFSSELYLDEFE